jgi:hypothetical protein
MISALMTNKNNPKVTSVTGKVSKIKIGFTNALSNPKTTATINEVVKLATATPGIKCAMITTRMAVIRILMSRFMINVFYKSKYFEILN